MAIETLHWDLDLNADGLTDEQLDRLRHHIQVSHKVFEASVAGMLKGVRKYGPEPFWNLSKDIAPLPGTATKAVLEHWLPHAFSDAVDTVNYLALMADALGVDLTQ